MSAQKFQVKPRRHWEDKMRRNPEAAVRVVRLCRAEDQEYGFAVRGGFEHKIGFFVSDVTKDSIAEQSGLKIGDEIVRVNGLSLEQTVMPELVRLVQHRHSLLLHVRRWEVLPMKRTTDSAVDWCPIKDLDPEQMNFVSVNEVMNAESPTTRPQTSSPPAPLSTCSDDLAIPEQPTHPAPEPPSVNIQNPESPDMQTESKFEEKPPLCRKGSSGGSSSLSTWSKGSTCSDSSKISTAPPAEPESQEKTSNLDIREQFQSELTRKLREQRKKLESDEEESYSNRTTNSPSQPSKQSSQEPSPKTNHYDQPANVTIPMPKSSVGSAQISPSTESTMSEQSGKPAVRNWKPALTENLRRHPVIRLLEENSTLESSDKSEVSSGESHYLKPKKLRETSGKVPENLLRRYEPGKNLGRDATSGLGASQTQSDKSFPVIGEVASALHNIHENCDPRLLFTDREMKGRSIQVVNVSKSILASMLVMKNHVLCVSYGEHGSLDKGLEEVLMIEGRSVAACSQAEIRSLLNSLSQDPIKLIVARDE